MAHERGTLIVAPDFLKPETPQKESQMSQQNAPQAPPSPLALSSHNHTQISDHLETCRRTANLVSPATAVGQLPEGWDVSTSVIGVDTDLTRKEVYKIHSSNDFGLSKVVIGRIAQAAAVRWDVDRSGRIDDGREPRLVHYRAIGYFRLFDGSEADLCGEKGLDLRDGSDTVEAMLARSMANNKDATGQIRDMRMFILEHAETKARLRAIRFGLGLKTSYTAEELKKPFVVARLVFSGRSTDPELAREFAMMRAKAAVFGRAALYGGTEAPQLPARRVVLNAPQNAWERDADDGLDPSVGTVANPPPARPSPSSAAPAPATTQTRPQGQQGPPQDSGSKAGAVWPWAAKKASDPNKGDSLSIVDDGALERLASYCEKKAGEGGQYAEKDAVLAAAARDEMAFRYAHANGGGNGNGANPENDGR